MKQKKEHSTYIKLSWNPFIVAIPFTYMVCSAIINEPTKLRIFSVCWVTLWFGLSLYNKATNNKFLDFLYFDEEEEKEPEAEQDEKTEKL